MRLSNSLLSLGLLGAVSVGHPACRPNGGAPGASSGVAGGPVKGVTVLYQNNANGEIEPCG